MLALEETFLSMCLSSRAIIFCFNSKTQWQMFLLLYGRHFVSLRRTQTWCLHTQLYEVWWHSSANTCNTRTCMKNSRDLIPGEVVYIIKFYYQSSIVSQILDFIDWMVTILHFDHGLVKTENKTDKNWFLQNLSLH